MQGGGSTYKTFFLIESIIAYYVLDAYEVVYYFIPVTDDANDIAYVLGWIYTLKRFFNWLDHLENEVEPGGFVFDHVNDISKTMQTFSRSRFIILSLISAKSDSIVRTLKTKSRFIIFPNFFPIERLPLLRVSRNFGSDFG